MGAYRVKSKSNWRAVLAGAALACAALLAGCKALTPDPSLDPTAREVYAQVRSRSPALQARLAPGLKTPQAIAQLEQVRAYIPPGEPTAGAMIGWNVSTVVGQQQTAVISHEYDYPGKVVLAQVAVQRPIGAKAWTVTGFHVQVATPAELEGVRFTLAGRKPGQYVFLAAMAASLGLMLAAVIKVIRSPRRKFKWLWLPVALLGVGAFQMNWFNGFFGWKLMNVSLIGFTAVKGFSRFDTWQLSFIFPLGAILILAGVLGRPRPTKARTEPTPAPAAVDPAS